MYQPCVGIYETEKHPTTTHPPAHILYACCMQIIYYAKTEAKPFIVEHAIALSLQNHFAYSVVRAHIVTTRRADGKLDLEIGKYSTHEQTSFSFHVVFEMCSNWLGCSSSSATEI